MKESLNLHIKETLCSRKKNNDQQKGMPCLLLDFKNKQKIRNSLQKKNVTLSHWPQTSPQQ